MKKYHKSNIAWFTGAVSSVFLSNLFAVALQFFKGSVLDHAVAGEFRGALGAAVWLLAFILLETGSFFIYRRLEERYAVGCVKCLKRDIFESILRRGYVEYKAYQQGVYISKYTTGADSIKRRRFDMLPLFWEILSKILLVSGALFLLDWHLALVTLALLTTPLYIPRLIEKRLQKAQSEYLKAVETSLAKVSDWLSGFEIIQNFSVERKILGLFDEANGSTMEKLLHDGQLGAAAQMITTLISYLSYFVVLVCAAHLVLKGRFTAGDFFVAIGMIDQLSYPLISLAEIIRQMIAVRPVCREMEQFLGEGTRVPAWKALEGFRAEIVFQNVRFAYPGGPELLHGLSFRIRKGECCLIQGPSGCGKTTAVNLLLQYYPVSGGSITIDGRDIREAGSTYGCMTVVRQEAVLFHDTLRNNLTMYRSVPDWKLIQVLNRLGLEKYASIQALDTVISESGANLSGGEKKRICLARALLRDTEILILDEPLANLDETTAARVEDVLLSVTDRTLIVVSHQFTAEKKAGFHHILDLGVPPQS